MARSKKNKVKNAVHNNPNAAVLNNSIYAVKGSRSNRPSKGQEIAATKQSKAALEKAKKMAKIEAYAKEHKVTIVQAMIHFMR